MNQPKHMKHHVKKWMLSALICICLIMTLIPVEYYGFSISGTGSEGFAARIEALSFEPLPMDISLQTVELGAPLEDLNLPNTLTAFCRQVTGNDSETPPETESEPEESTQTTETQQPEPTESTQMPETETQQPETTDSTQMPETETQTPETTDSTQMPETETQTPPQPETEQTPTPQPELSPWPENTDSPSQNGGETPEDPTVPQEIPQQPKQDSEPAVPSETSTVKPADTSVSVENDNAKTTSVTIEEHYSANETSMEFKEVSLKGSDLLGQTSIIEGILWKSSPEYDATTEGTYFFTPILPAGYTLAEGAALPEITVVVGNPELYTLHSLDEEEMPKSKPACGTISENTIWEAGSLPDGELIINAGTTLTLTGAVSVEGSVSISGGGTIARGNAQACLLVKAGKSLTINDTVISGSSIPSGESMISAMMGTVTLGNGCRILDCVKEVPDSGAGTAESGGATSGSGTGGAAIHLNRSSATLEQAEISNCSSSFRGGAVYAMGSAITINGGTYQNNRTTAAQPRGGGFLYNDASNVTINSGSFINNSSTGQGGCIYHSGAGGTETKLAGGYFQGNVSSMEGCQGSGAIWNSSVATGQTKLSLSGAVQFCGDGREKSGTDGIYLDQQDETQRKIYITGALNTATTIYVKASEGYVIAEGEGYTLTDRDMKKIKFVDIANSDRIWYAVLNAETNQIYISETDPEYGLTVSYISNGAQGSVIDETLYHADESITIKSADALSLDGQFFIGWNTASDGSGIFYQPGSVVSNLTDDLTLYAIFTASLSAKFYSGSADTFETIDGKDNGGMIHLPELKPMEGYTPIGWALEDSADYIGGFKPGDSYTLLRDASFYGVYQKPIALSYDANGGEETPRGRTNQLFANVHEEITYDLPEFTLNGETSRVGYTLKGWAANPDGSGVVYDLNSKAKFDKDTTLYAYWLPENETAYVVEHYQQNVTGDGYTKIEADTQNLTAATDSTVEAEAKTYIGFTENTSHTSRVASGVVSALNTLTLKLYYDRDAYEVDFNLNYKDSGNVPNAQTILYGGRATPPEEPERTGYSFKGWHKDQNGTAGSQWDFENTVETNTNSRFVTLYAKWADEIAPVLGDASFNEGFKNFLNQIIRKKSLIITVPVTEEGSGIKEANYTLLSEDEPETNSKRETSSSGKQAAIETDENGQTIAKIVIDEDFKGKVFLTCTDHAGNISREKSMTAEDGKIIVEDNAPEIRFSTKAENGEDWHYDSATINVVVEDEAASTEESRVSGGIASIVYTIDEGTEIAASDKGFDEDTVTYCCFDVTIKEAGIHTLSVTAVDHAGNVTIQQKSVEIRRQQRKYKVEHYRQTLNGNAYARVKTDSQELMGEIGATVTAEPKTYTGFTENTSHELRTASGVIDENGSLTLKFYYDRNTYEIGFDLNGGKGEAPAKQTVRYGGLLESVEAPKRNGYEFKGWYLNTAGTDDSKWDFSQTAENNISQNTATLYAKWADETAPVLGDTTYNDGYRNALNYIIRRPELFLTIPIIEEGSGVKQADFTLMPEDGELSEGKAKIETVNGTATAKISITDDYKGVILLSATDNAGNVSAEKIITAEDGIIVEDDAPEISFSTKNGSISDWFTNPVTVNVSVKDNENHSRISGGLQSVIYQIDNGAKTPAPDEDFSNELIEECDFSVQISTKGEHFLKVTAVDNLGNETTRQVKIKLKEAPKKKPAAKITNAPAPVTQQAQETNTIQTGSEPQTGDASQIEFYVTIAMLSGVLYVFFLLRGKTPNISIYGKKKKRKKEDSE